jgi:periplasmic protein TonB
MTPSAVATVRVREESRPQVTSPATCLAPSAPSFSVSLEAARGRAMFNDSLLENYSLKSGSKKLDFLVALLFHIAAIGGPILAGLYYTGTISLREYATTLMVAPPPPPPPPAPSVVRAQGPKRVFMKAGQLIAPTVIPRHVAELKEAPLEPDNLGGVDGVLGGVPGGQMGGVIGGVLGGIPNTAAKPPAPTTSKVSGPLRVGGRVRPPKAILQLRPAYPVLAKQAHVQGNVQIDAILDEQGNVVNMKVVSGPPLLYQAALDALKSWKYEPTFLNDQPVAVQMIVTVTFQLGQ